MGGKGGAGDGQGEQSQGGFNWEFLIDAASAGLAATTATAITHPIDTVKTRLQASKSVGLNALREAVYGTERSANLFFGMKPVIIGASTASAVKFSLYEAITKTLAGGAVGYASLIRATTACICSTFSSLFYVPWEGLKQRMQTAVQPLSLRASFNKTWQNGGLPSLYRGWRATVSRDIPFTAIELVIYDGIKTYLRNRVGGRELHTSESLVIGGFSGAVAGALTCPVDVLKTRLMTGTAASLSIRQTVQVILHEEGFGALFRGVGARVSIIAPLTAIFFCVFEGTRSNCRKFLRLSPAANAH